MGKSIEMSDIRIVMSCTFCSVCTSISWVMDEVYIGAAHLTYGIINRLWEIAAAAGPTPKEGEASSSSSLLAVVAPELSASWINFVANLACGSRNANWPIERVVYHNCSAEKCSRPSMLLVGMILGRVHISDSTMNT